MRICDETGFGFGWISPEPALLERASHALRADGRVWLVDAVDEPGVEERVRALGAPAGVVQLVDRHERDCAALAERLGVPRHRVPFGGVPGSPFEVLRVADLPGWREAALWWPEERVLVCTEALGAAGYFTGPGERLAVHPFLRLYQPQGLRRLARELRPAHVLVGHGEGVHGDDAPAAVAEAVTGARRRAPRWLLHQIRGRRGR
ncbi:MAG TPA: hypothetical protein VD704_04600 [Gaiellaceae bacterium]|nr:hypothetical protein [Gaiellaceae bacterium]